MEYGHIIEANNVNDALPKGLRLVSEQGISVAPRGVSTLEVPGPVMTIYKEPWNRVLLDAVRDANPFFHLFEAMWILAGQRSVGPLARFVPSIAQFSDNGVNFHGAYGHRLRYMNAHADQLKQAVELLKKDPSSRQVVLQIWSARADLGSTTKDRPCNTQVYVKIREGKLNMTVCNRSNDMIWGCYGANAVQFPFIQEYLAAHLRVGIGPLVQVSDSLHVYDKRDDYKKLLNHYSPQIKIRNPYDTPRPPGFCNFPLIARYIECNYFDTELTDAVQQGPDVSSLFPEYDSPFLRRVFVPMTKLWRSHELWRADKKRMSKIDFCKKIDSVVSTSSPSRGVDWIEAGIAWMARREVQ